MTPEQALAYIEQERLDVLAEGQTEEECNSIAAYVLASAYRRLLAARPEAVPPALQMALGNHSIGVFDAAGKLLAADADVYAAPESKPERADTAELVYRLQAYTTSFGSDTEGLSLLPEAWNTLRADIEEACRVLAVPSPLAPISQEKS